MICSYAVDLSERSVGTRTGADAWLTPGDSKTLFSGDDWNMKVSENLYTSQFRLLKNKQPILYYIKKVPFYKEHN